ncbi:MAG: ZIP family metal transporter [Candidatus Paceibacterota bacterium]
MEFEILGAAFVVMLTSLIGIIFVNNVAHDFLEKRLAYLVSFSAGVFLVTAGGLALEVFHVAPSTVFGVMVILAGYILAWGMHKLLPETHHHHDPHCERSHKGAKKLIIGDSIHNVADGIILVTAFSVSPALGIAVTISIIIHESLQEISEFFILKQAGYTTKTALLINFASASTILIGAFLGYSAINFTNLETALLGVSAGFFLHVVIHDLLPKRSHHANKPKFVHQIILVIIGAILMSLIANLLPEPLEHGADHHLDEHATADHH